MNATETSVSRHELTESVLVASRGLIGIAASSMPDGDEITLSQYRALVVTDSMPQARYRTVSGRSFSTHPQNLNPGAPMTDTPSPDPHPFHLEHLAADADDVVAMLTRHHEAGGDVHPEALPKAERLATTLRQLIAALGTHEPLAASTDDVLRMLGVEPGHDGSPAER